MSGIKPSSHGIVVQNKESGQFYASTDSNFNPEWERKVRDLRNGESVLSYGIKEAPEGWTVDVKHVSAEPDETTGEEPVTDPNTGDPDNK